MKHQTYSSENMKFSTVIFLVLFAVLVLNPDTCINVVNAGFGCPVNEYECSDYCRSIGKNGGHCGNWFRQTCYCNSAVSPP